MHTTQQLTGNPAPAQANPGYAKPPRAGSAVIGRVPAQSAGLASRFCLEPGRRAQASERRRLRHELELATATAAFEMQYEPRLCLASGRPTGAEALLRWPHRKRGVIPPASFLPLAEQYGQMTAIGGWALNTACVAAAGWDGGMVSLAVSGRQLVEGALLGQVAAALELSDLAAERLEIALPEAAMGEVGFEALLMLSAVRDLGVSVAVEDFGSAIGSLSMLKRLPLTALKLDRSVVRGLPEDREDAAIVRAAIAAAHAMGLTVVAEGIETEAQRAFLDASGCDEGQGHLFCPPLSDTEAGARIAEGA